MTRQQLLISGQEEINLRTTEH